MGSRNILPEGFHASTSASAGFGVGNEKATMQSLNNRLASYLEMVRTLEEKNSKLELLIRETLEKKGPEGYDYSRYEAMLSQLRKEILEATLSNARMAIHIDNNSLTVEDFKTKFEHELQIRQNVECDIRYLRKALDDSNVRRLHLENDVETLNEQLITLKKNHQQEVTTLQNEIAQAGVHVDVDALKGQDLAQIMEEMRAKYEKMALESQKGLKAWHDSKITEVEVQVTENTAALKDAKTQVQESHKKIQSLEIELQSQIGLQALLKGSLEEVHMRYNMQLEQYNAIILQRGDELMELRGSIQKQRQDYAIMLNLKGELEAEIETYKKLLENQEEPQLRINLMRLR